MISKSDNKEMEMLEFHHIGLLVDKINNALPHYLALFGKKNISKIEYIDSQKVKICFIKIASNSYIELVEPVGEKSPVYKLLKKQIGYYHIGYKVSDIINVMTKLEALNYKPMSFFNSEAFDNKRCLFLFSPEAHLIELIEK